MNIQIILFTAHSIAYRTVIVYTDTRYKLEDKSKTC